MSGSRRLPPFTALRTFEAAARLLSFTKAAEELFVTQAAVSRQVRELEDRLGIPLFHRLHRHVKLTPEGAKLAEHLTASFDALAHAVEAIVDPGTETLRVSVEPALAARWLAPRLNRYHAAHPGIHVALSSTDALVKVGWDADLAIRWSKVETSWVGAIAEELIKVEAFPVMAPSMRGVGWPLKQPSDMLGLTLLFDDDRSLWTRWFEKAGVTDVSLPRGPVFSDLALALDAAARGEGIALGETALVAEDLASGRLTKPFSLSVELGCYFLLTPISTPRGRAVDSFSAWVRTEMAATLNGNRSQDVVL